MWKGAVGSSWKTDRNTVKLNPHITKNPGVNRRCGADIAPHFIIRSRAHRPAGVDRAPVIVGANVSGRQGLTLKSRHDAGFQRVQAFEVVEADAVGSAGRGSAA